MSVIVPLQAIPNQNLSIVLDDFVYDITLKAANDVMGMTLIRDNVTLLSGLRVVAGTPLIPYRYLEGSNFIFITDNDELPNYERFGTTQLLLYFSSDELGVIRGSA